MLGTLSEQDRQSQVYVLEVGKEVMGKMHSPVKHREYSQGAEMERDRLPISQGCQAFQ